MSNRSCRPSRGFTLIELLLVIGVIALLIAILLPAISNSRKTARMSICMSNMRQVGIAQGNYANQYKDLISTFNRKPPTWPRSGQWTDEAGLQAHEIVLRLTGKDLGVIRGRYLHRNYWHLPAVADGAFGTDAGSLFSPVVGCPEDTVILGWKKHFNNSPALLTGMGGDGVANTEKYRPFWSSYQQIVAAWAPDVRDGDRRTINQSSTLHHLYSSVSLPGLFQLGHRQVSDVALPSNKVWFFDLYDRHYFTRRGRVPMIWHGYLQARQPLLFFDGSVRTQKTGDARDGLVSPDSLQPRTNVAHRQLIDRPENATDGQKSYTYNPNNNSAWKFYDPPTMSGQTSEKVYGKYRWTAGGLKGFDYSGKSSSTGN